MERSAIRIYWFASCVAVLEAFVLFSFGLDLSACAATGARSDLVYVSPRSGRAVSREAGKPYCDRLLKLPLFLLDDTAEATGPDIVAGFALTGHFLEHSVLAPHGLNMPQARERLIGLLSRATLPSAAPQHEDAGPLT